MLCLFATSFCWGQENNTDDGNAVKGEGWVIDLESSSITYSDSTSAQPSTDSKSGGRLTGNSNIEFFIGGQGKDGVAKKGKLPISD